MITNVFYPSVIDQVQPDRVLIVGKTVCGYYADQGYSAWYSSAHGNSTSMSGGNTTSTLRPPIIAKRQANNGTTIPGTNATSGTPNTNATTTATLGKPMEMQVGIPLYAANVAFIGIGILGATFLPISRRLIRSSNLFHSDPEANHLTSTLGSVAASSTPGTLQKPKNADSLKRKPTSMTSIPSYYHKAGTKDLEPNLRVTAVGKVPPPVSSNSSRQPTSPQQQSPQQQQQQQQLTVQTSSRPTSPSTAPQTRKPMKSIHNIYTIQCKTCSQTLPLTLASSHTCPPSPSPSSPTLSSASPTSTTFGSLEPLYTQRAKRPYVPVLSDEIRLERNELVRVYEVYEDGWGVGENESGEMGAFPLGCLDSNQIRDRRESLR
ncbi:uncharacterized protein SPPG_00346 [Spizellomyces punctatus DAOM BR117]|uniref:SH3 domain-containing protein n=1 Tax=Spizellomyces punctatus (strain DAOM BR117) TaxID=645134 RepID=A0A0L0HUU3_SPIPD|nr:uncharacterized protein SPPG_00346 [Spizellomyces punctatus DAOM BR117]KND04629.1 hypothetical protein SPPG_00346 [Spizellomyces punctatus DAOM BR117]|eukprot:XP_016612668.1 hypothetical protein SPPG_00346 [Spizellomyces punctatus DAOM BR117]